MTRATWSCTKPSYRRRDTGGQTVLLYVLGWGSMGPCSRQAAIHTHECRKYGGCAGLGLTACLYLTANDGTLMSAEKAQRWPLHTFQSGPVNSLRGAAKLSGLSGVRAFIHSFHVYICCSGSGFSQNENWLPSPVPESFSISLRCCCSTYTACGDRQAVTIKSHPDDHVNNSGATHAVYHPACNHVSLFA